MNKVTEEKWEVVNAGEKPDPKQLFWGYHIFSGAKHIAKIFDDEGTETKARLIAAAPEMYETLERCLGYIKLRRRVLAQNPEYDFLNKLENDIRELLKRIDITEDEND